MDSSHLVPGYPDYLSCCSQKQEARLPLTDKPSPCASGFGCSVQILDVLDYECLNRRETHQATQDSPYTLDNYSIDHLPAVDECLSFLGSISPIESDQFVSDCASVPEYLTFPPNADSTSIDNWQMPRPPLCSTAAVEQFNKITQQFPTGTATLTAIESFGSPTSLAAKGVHTLGIGKSSHSAKGKRTRANYLSIDKRKMAQARSQAKFNASAKGRMSRAKTNARYHAYSKAKMEGFSEELAREKGEVAARERERRYVIESQQTCPSHSR